MRLEPEFLLVFPVIFGLLDYLLVITGSKLKMLRSALLTCILDSSITSYLFIVLVVFGAVHRFLAVILNRKVHLLASHSSEPSTPTLPGPRGLPFVGNLLSLIGADAIFHLKLTEWAKKYGGIYRLSLGSSEAVILSDPAMIREAFKMEQFSARPDMLFVKQIVNGNGLIFSEGELWKEQRRFALQQMRHFGMYRLAAEEDQLTQKIHGEIHEFMHVLEEYNETPVDLDHLLSRMIGNILCTTICGKRFEYSDPTFLRCLDTMEEGSKLVKLAMGINYLPVLRSVPMMNTIFLKIKSNNLATKAFFRSLISERAETMEPGISRDFVDAYLHQIQKLRDDEKFDASFFTDAQMMQCVIDLFGAGMDTTKTSLQWAFLYMALHPHVQERVQEELDRFVGTDRAPTMDDQKDLKFTEATICEILRCSSVFPLGMPHEATEDTMFRGFTVRKGATIFSNLYAVHHNEKLWKNPAEFNPERFLVNGQVEKPSFFMPFSTGRRVCLGDQLAKAEMFLVITSVLQRFHLASPSGEPKPDANGILGMSLKPKPHRLIATLRKTSAVGLPKQENCDTGVTPVECS